jgi:hypothetical protein
MKKYRVDFYDMFDGWIGRGDVVSFFGYDYDDLDEAKRKCIELNEKLDPQNKSAGEHWGAIDMEKGVFLCAP